MTLQMQRHLNWKTMLRDIATDIYDVTHLIIEGMHYWADSISWLTTEITVFMILPRHELHLQYILCATGERTVCCPSLPGRLCATACHGKLCATARHGKLCATARQGSEPAGVS